MKTKFQVETDNDIILEDDHGAEVDEEVFPILLDQGIIPAITFKIVGEDAASDGSYTPQCQQIYYSEFYNLDNIINNNEKQKKYVAFLCS